MSTMENTVISNSAKKAEDYLHLANQFGLYWKTPVFLWKIQEAIDKEVKKAKKEAKIELLRELCCDECEFCRGAWSGWSQVVVIREGGWVHKHSAFGKRIPCKAQKFQSIIKELQE